MMVGPLARHGVADAVADKRSVETHHLILTTSILPRSASRLSLVVDVTPKPKMHVYAPGQAGYIPVALTLDGNRAFTAAPARFPTPEKIYLKTVNETQLVYSKPFRIVEDLTLTAPMVAVSPLVVKGSLRYQACDDRVCYLPQTVPLTWPTAPTR